jgi:hypothetical protein
VEGAKELGILGVANEQCQAIAKQAIECLVMLRCKVSSSSKTMADNHDGNPCESKKLRRDLSVELRTEHKVEYKLRRVSWYN